MRPASAIVAVLLCASLQAAAPAAPPPPSDAPRRIPAAEQVQVNLVLIDVVVRDGKGNPVPGLTRDAFELLVDRLPIEPAAIESFEAICPAQPEAAESTTTAEASGAPPATPPESAPEAASPRHLVVIFDFSHLSLSGRRQSLQAARNYFSNRLQPGDRVMLLAYKTGMHLLQDFTSSPSLLAARVDELLPDTTSLEGEVLEEGSKMTDVSRRPCEGENLEAMRDTLGSSCLGRRSIAHSYAVEEEGRTRRALRSIEDLMPALASLRGRKALVIFSDVLRDEPGIQYLALARTSPLSLGVDVKEDILRLTREANAAGVAIYSVHASGLDDASRVMFAHSPGDVQETTERRDPVLATAARTGLDAALSLQATLATETGGRAVQRTNDLASVLDVVRQDFSCHYLIGYHHAGRGDNQRHSLIVRMRPGPDGRPRRYEVRHRPYYIDYAPAERRNRLVRSALDVPRLHSSVPVGLEAFALTPGSKGRRLLLKATVPLASLSLLPSADGRLDGRVRVTGEVVGPSGVMCARDAEVPVSVPRAAPGAAAAERLVYETECDLPPGSYDLSLSVLDLTSMEIGAHRAPLVVPRPPAGREPLVSDVHLWVRDPAAVLVTSDAAGIGLKDRPAGEQTGAFVPLARRRLSVGQPAILSLLMCPAAGARVDADHPIRARRTLRGDAGATVADFRDLTFTEPPDRETGCYQLFHQIPAGTLGVGVYTFTLQAQGEALGPPLTREADLAVE